MQTATNTPAIWAKIPRLQRSFANPEAYEAHCSATDRILSHRPAPAARRETPAPRPAPAARRETPAPRPAPVQRSTIAPDQTAEVTDPEDAMLKRAKQVFSANPGLKQTYGTAEAFARTCMKADRETEKSKGKA